MMNGIWFDNIHSHDDLNLVLSKVDIPPATVKTNYVDNPGGDGSWDLTEAHGKINYKDRECKYTFTVFPHDDFEAKKTEVSNLLNGKRCKIILDKDPEYCWDGRCSVNQYESNKKIRKIVVNATVSPYKLKKDVTKVVVPSGENVIVNLVNGRKMVTPTITCATDAIVIFNGGTYTFGAGTHRNLNITLTMGDNQINVTSTKDVTFMYQEGDL